MAELMDNSSVPTSRERGQRANGTQSAGRVFTSGAPTRIRQRSSAKTEEQVAILLAAYADSTDLSGERKERLAASTGLTVVQVRDWFYNTVRVLHSWNISTTLLVAYCTLNYFHCRLRTVRKW